MQTNRSMNICAHFLQAAHNHMNLPLSICLTLSPSLTNARTRLFMHKSKMKRNKAECDVIRGNLVCVFCSVTKNLFLAFKRLIWSMCSETQTTQSNWEKTANRHSFARLDVSSTSVSATLHSCILECRNNVWLSSCCHCRCGEQNCDLLYGDR